MTHWRFKKMNVELFFKMLGDLYGAANNVKVTYTIKRRGQEAQ